MKKYWLQKEKKSLATVARLAVYLCLHDSWCVTGMYGPVCPASMLPNYLSLSVSVFLTTVSHEDACITVDKMSQYVS